MKRYELTYEGLTPIIMHHDNIVFSERIGEWRRDPANKEHSEKGDDRSPPWTWIGYVYHDRKHFGIPADNLMTNFREGGAKVTKKGKESYKKQTQAGIIVDAEQFDLHVGGNQIPVQPFEDLIGDLDFGHHLDAAEAHGFELLVKRARVGQAKHMRVRPLFRNWVATGTITIPDEELSGLSLPILKRILIQCGTMVGLFDWRPSSPKSGGSYGKFEASIKEIAV